MKRRIVITGMGIVSPAGNDIETFWKNLTEGVSCGGQITKFDATGYECRIACEVNGFLPEAYMDKKSARRMEPFVQYAVAASTQALKSAGLLDAANKIDAAKIDPTRIGVVVGSGIGGITMLEEQHKTLLEKGWKRISPFFIPMMISNMASGMISIHFGVKGPSACVTTACATGNNCIGESLRLLQYGDADIMIAGGTEASISPLSIAGFIAAQAMSIRNDDPKHASRPFDKNRDGFVMGEGSGVLVLEEMEHALKRGAKIYGELSGYGLSSDAYHMTATSPTGEGGARAMANAVKDAGAKPEDVDYINAHGTSTPVGDPSETQAIKTTFGEHAYKLCVSSNKSMIGHLLGAAGGAETIATVLTVINDLVPPTINYEEKDPACDLDYVPNKAIKRTVNLAISNSFGFGGHNATLAIKKFKQ
ncbi:MAG: beta-ketoacyl-ACP synthase II [Candidatus Firestonebacteria bacterium]